MSLAERRTRAPKRARGLAHAAFALAVITAGAGFVTVTPSSPSAAVEVCASPQANASSTNIAVGTSVTITGCGFTPSEFVDAHFSSDHSEGNLGNDQVSGSGQVTFTFTPEVEGKYSVVLEERSSTKVPATVTIDVTAKPSPSATASASPTASPTSSTSPSPTSPSTSAPEPTSSPSDTPTRPQPEPTAQPTVKPTTQPDPDPTTDEPDPTPTSRPHPDQPTDEPSTRPNPHPTTDEPDPTPTSRPHPDQPTDEPTDDPSSAPSSSPSSPGRSSTSAPGSHGSSRGSATSHTQTEASRRDGPMIAPRRGTPTRIPLGQIANQASDFGAVGDKYSRLDQTTPAASGESAKAPSQPGNASAGNSHSSTAGAVNGDTTLLTSNQQMRMRTQGLSVAWLITGVIGGLGLAAIGALLLMRRRKAEDA